VNMVMNLRVPLKEENLISWVNISFSRNTPLHVVSQSVSQFVSRYHSPCCSCIQYYWKDEGFSLVL
jgi:hypothetical protein